MTSKLWQKLALVVAITLVCLYGVIGIPSSLDELRQNVADNIPLGLDLKGGTHLILQVQVQDAIRAEADQVIARLREDLNRQGILFDSIERNDPQTIEEADSIALTVSGVPTESSGDFRSTIDEVFIEWLHASVDSTTYKLTMRPAMLAAIKGNTVTQAITTIENRVNGLGLTEPVIQQHGRADAEYEILVQLPGLSEPGRVMEILQMTALLEIQEVLDGPFMSREQTLSNSGGILPPNSEILSERTRSSGGQSLRQWYILTRTPVVTGRDLRNASAGRDPQTNQWETRFSLSREAGFRFGDFTQARIGQGRLSVVLDNRIVNVATIQDRITDEGRIMGLSEQEAIDLALVLRAGVAAGERGVPGAADSWSITRQGLDPAGRSQFAAGHGAGRDLDGGLLSQIRRQCGCGAAAQSSNSDRGLELLRPCTHLAWDCRNYLDDRYGGRCQCADL